MQWLVPHYVRDGLLHMGIYSFLVETPDRKIVVDTAVGNGKTRAGTDLQHARHRLFRELPICLAARRCRRCGLYPFACRPCRLEYPSGQWQVGADFFRTPPTTSSTPNTAIGSAPMRISQYPMFDSTAVFSGLCAPDRRRRTCYLCRTVGPPDAGSRVDPVARPYPRPRRGARRVEGRERGDHRRPHAHPVPDRPAGLVGVTTQTRTPPRSPGRPSWNVSRTPRERDRHPFRHTERLPCSPRRVHLPAVACGLAIRWRHDHLAPSVRSTRWRRCCSASLCSPV